jgi:hypothetical protein
MKCAAEPARKQCVTVCISSLGHGRFQAVVGGGSGDWTERLAPAASPPSPGVGRWHRECGTDGSPDMLVIVDAVRVVFTFTVRTNSGIDTADFSRTQ